MRFFSDKMCGSFTCSKNTLVGLNVIYILVSFLMIGVAVHGKHVVDMYMDIRGQTLCQNNRQLIGMSLIGLARQAKNRSQLYFLLKCSLSIWAYGGV